MCIVGLRAARFGLPILRFTRLWLDTNPAPRGSQRKNRNMEQKQNTRPRGKPIKVFVTDDEREVISDLARSANLPLSAYLRAAGMNQPVRSIFDIHAVTELAKLNGELGRLAAVLKTGNGTTPTTLKELRDLQKQSHEIMGRFLR